MAELTPEEQAKESEVASGLLPFTIDGTVRHVPELKRRANRKWQELLQATFIKLATVPGDTPSGIAAMSDAEADLVMAYDATHALGDLDDATEREIDAVYNRLIEVSFPQATSQVALMVAIIRAAAESAPASSTSSPLPPGTTETPTILTTRSPSAKSSSSTRRRRPA